MRRCLLTAAFAVVSVSFAGIAAATHEADTPSARCHYERAKAAAKYEKCVSAALSKAYLNDDYIKLDPAVLKCVHNYGRTWPKLQAKFSGSGTTCDNPRFGDNGDGTVTDRLTGLQWEQKTDDGTVHDKDNVYSTGLNPGELANGTAFTTFLPALNGGACFADHCDWRLPARDELLTLLMLNSSYPACNPVPCIDPLLGPTEIGEFWSSTPIPQWTAAAISSNWTVDSAAELTSSMRFSPHYVRAVRAGF